MAKSITYVGLDVHKDTIAVALAEAGLRGEVREHGKIPNTPAALKALTVKLAPAEERAAVLLRGRTVRLRHSTTTHRSGARMCGGRSIVDPAQARRADQNDRRDAINLAKLHRAGELTRSGCRIRPMRRSAIWSVRVRRRCAPCAKPASNCPASCCATAITTIARPGRCCTGAGWQASSSSRRCIISCWKIASRPSRRRRHGATAGGTYRSSVAGVVSRTGGASAASAARRGSGGRGHTDG